MSDRASPGYLIPIGGAERKNGNARVLRRFVDLGGGPNARIAILPTASKLDTTGPRYERVFREFGAGDAYALPFRTRQDCAREDWLEAWQYLVDTGVVWGLQGWFGRTAAALIEEGEIFPAKEST